MISRRPLRAPPPLLRNLQLPCLAPQIVGILGKQPALGYEFVQAAFEVLGGRGRRQAQGVPPAGTEPSERVKGPDRGTRLSAAPMGARPRGKEKIVYIGLGTVVVIIVIIAVVMILRRR